MTISRLFTDFSVPLHATSADYLRYHERLREGLRLAGMPESRLGAAPSVIHWPALM